LLIFSAKGQYISLSNKYLN